MGWNWSAAVLHSTLRLQCLCSFLPSPLSLTTAASKTQQAQHNWSVTGESSDINKPECCLTFNAHCWASNRFIKKCIKTTTKVESDNWKENSKKNDSINVRNEERGEKISCTMNKSWSKGGQWGSLSGLSGYLPIGWMEVRVCSTCWDSLMRHIPLWRFKTMGANMIN